MSPTSFHCSTPRRSDYSLYESIAESSMGAELLVAWRRIFFCRLVFFVGSVGKLENNFALLYKFLFFASDAFDGFRIVAEVLNVAMQRFVLFGCFIDFLLELFSFQTTLADGERAMLVEYREQEHRDGQQSKDADGDSRYQ